MALVNWDNKYSVKIPSLDTHHKKLFELLNKLDESTTEDQINAVIRELISYTQYHFEKEEEIMKTNGYPEFTSHMKEHLDLIKKVKEYTNQFHSAGFSLANFKDFLKNWLSDHILKTDMKYGVHFDGKGIQ